MSKLPDLAQKIEATQLHIPFQKPEIGTSYYKENDMQLKNIMADFAKIILHSTNLKDFVDVKPWTKAYSLN